MVVVNGSLDESVGSQMQTCIVQGAVRNAHIFDPSICDMHHPVRLKILIASMQTQPAFDIKK